MEWCLGPFAKTAKNPKPRCSSHAFFSQKQKTQKKYFGIMDAWKNKVKTLVEVPRTTFFFQ